MARGMDTAPFKAEPGRHYTNDPDGALPYETYEHLVAQARRMGLWGLDVPEELGGNAISVLGKMIVHEEIHRSLVPFTLPPDSPNLHWMLAVCTPEQRERYLEPYARGEISACLAATEPNAGSEWRASDHRGTQGRPVDAQRPQDVHQPRRLVEFHDRPGEDRQGAGPAWRDHRVPGRPGHPRHDDSAAHRDYGRGATVRNHLRRRGAARIARSRPGGLGLPGVAEPLLSAAGRGGDAVHRRVRAVAAAPGGTGQRRSPPSAYPWRTGRPFSGGSPTRRREFTPRG